MAAERAMSKPRVELWVGIIARPAKKRWLSLSTCTQRTGRLLTGRTAGTKRELLRWRRRARRSLWSRRLRSRWNTSSSVVKFSVNETDDDSAPPLTRLHVIEQR